MKTREPILIVLFCDLEMSEWRDKMRQKILLQRPISWFIGSVSTLSVLQKKLTAFIIAHVFVDIESNLGNGLILIQQ